MSEENQGIDSHIKFAPLILERKTPAEELRELTNKVCVSSNEQIEDRLNEIAARLEDPDEPKGWDEVFPWVAQTVFPRDCRVYFAERLSMFCDMEAERVVLNETHQNKNQSPYHDGVIITITAGDGTEDVKVLRGTVDDRWLYLALGEHSVVLTDPYGDAVGEAKDRWPMHCEPLPPGTVTRITINHTLPTTADRYEVEFVEPPKPKFKPISLLHGDTVVSVQDATVVNYQYYRRAVMTPPEARQVAAALTAAANYIEKKE